MTITRTPDTNESTTERFLQFLEYKRFMQSCEPPCYMSWSYETYCEHRFQDAGEEPEHAIYHFLTNPSEPFKIVTQIQYIDSI